MSEEKRQVVVVEIELPQQERLLLFVNKPIYKHQDLTEQGNGNDFYYYNIHTCPINWLRDVKQIAHVNENGVIEMDPHGIFRVAMTEHNVEIAEDCMDRDDDYQVIAFRYLEKESQVLRFLSAIEKDEDQSIILELWNKIIDDRQALMVLSKVCFEKDNVLIVELTKTGYSIYHAANTIEITCDDKATLDRIKFLLEFEILTACNY